MLRLYEQPDIEDVEVELESRLIRRAGFGFASNIPMSITHINMMTICHTFIREATAEIERISCNAEHRLNDTTNSDINGEPLYAGDIVIICDGGRLDGWTASLHSRSMGGQADIIIGMPPTHETMTKELYDDMRRNRPRDRHIQIMMNKLRLVINN